MSVTGIITGAKAATTTYKLAKQAKELGLLDKLTNVFKKKHKILVLGATGVGKTLFLKSIIEELPKAISNLNRTNSIEKTSLKIAENIFVFVDTPGQIKRKTKRMEAIREAMGGKIEGIINVVAFGYHESNTDKKTVFDDNRNVRAEFLETRRGIEVELLNEWTELLGDKTTANWLVTLVNKADLWWDNKEQVIQYYEEGEYFNSLGQAKVLSPTCLHYSTIFQKFYNESPLCGTFDDNDRREAKEILLDNLISAIGKGGLRL